MTAGIYRKHPCAGMEASVMRETEISTAHPLIDRSSGAAFWGAGNRIWRRGPRRDDSIEAIGKVPDDLIGFRTIERLATHLTLSADGRELFLDTGAGLQWIFGSLTIEGGLYTHWHTFNRSYNHAQFNPVDPDLVLFAEEIHEDQLTGHRFWYDNRLWMIRRGGKAYPALSTPKRVCHEWWSADGKRIMFSFVQ